MLLIVRSLYCVIVKAMIQESIPLRENMHKLISKHL